MHKLILSNGLAKEEITQGDTASLALTAKDELGAAFDLTGAAFQTQIRAPGGVVKTFLDTQHTADPDQTANKGKFVFALAAADTLALAAAAGHEIVTKVTQGATINFFHGKEILTVLSALPDSIE